MLTALSDRRAPSEAVGRASGASVDGRSIGEDDVARNAGMTSDVTLERVGHVTVVELHRPPENFFDVDLIRTLADSLESLDADVECRSVVLCSEGKHFCAGARIDDSDRDATTRTGELYEHGLRLFATSVPIVAAVQGAAVGGGLGLALAADFRVASPESRFSCNFARLGFHHGFGLSVTLPAVVGTQRALELMYTGGQLKGDAAFAAGLCDRLAPADQLRSTAIELAQGIASSAPLAVREIRRTMRGTMLEDLRKATEIERGAQARLRATEDFREGTRAFAERRVAEFTGR
jgi:enoyl-CoA hydratase/carnithine racemase